MRSNAVDMSLILLCGENDLKMENAKVFSEMLLDFKDLEENRIKIGCKMFKVALYCIAGDNLGSHSIGGFTENFNCPQYSCRYREITQRMFSW